MDVINRSVAVIRPKAPCMEWIRSLPSLVMFTDEEFQSLSTAVLIPEMTREEARAYIKELAPRLFELELAAWDTDRTLWPANRNYESFLEWFSVDTYDLVLDSVEDEILKEPY